MSARMRIAEFVLEKYGPYADRALHFRPEASLHLVLGRNEAGKSVTLSALTDLICGFPPRIEAADMRVSRFKSAELRLAGKFLRDDGQILAFQRRAGRSKTLLSWPGYEPLDESLFRTFAGAPDREVFKSEFGLTTEELRKGGEALLQAEGRLAESLAAGSAQLAHFSRVRTMLLEQAAEIYEPTGRKRQINQARQRYEDAVKSLRDAIVTPEALKRAQEALEAGRLRESNAKQRSKDIETRKALRERARRTRGKLRDLAAKKQSLLAFTELPSVELAQLQEWRSALTRQADLDEKAAEANRRLRALELDAHSMAVPPDILADANAIGALRERLGAADDASADLPKQEEAAANAWRNLAQAASNLGLDSADALVERMPSEISFARVRESIRERRDLEAARASAAKRLETALARKRALERSGPAPAENPASLRDAFECFADIPGAARRTYAQAAEIEEQAARLEREAQRLSPPVASLTALVRLACPDVSAIESALRQSTDLADQERELEQAFEANAQRMSEYQKQLDALAREGEIASPESMRAQRRRRDEIVDLLENDPRADEQARAMRFLDLRRTIAEADRLADILREGSDRAARQATIFADWEQAQRQHATLSERRQSLTSAQAAFCRNWQALWSDCGIQPLTPEVMRDWRRTVDTLIERFESLASLRTSLAAAQAELSARVAALAALARRLGVDMPESAPADLHAQAGAALAALNKAWDDSRAHAVKSAAADAEIDEIRREIEELDQRADENDHIWRETLAILSLRADAVLSEAERALEIWREASSNLGRVRDAERRVRGMRQRIEAFDTQASELVARHARELAGQPSRIIVDQLQRQLEQAQRMASEQERNAKERARLEIEIKELVDQRASIRALLDNAAATLNVDIDQLPAALEAQDERRRLQDEIAMLQRDLSETGDGRRAEELEEEQRTLDLDALDADIAALEVERDVVLAEVRDAAIAADTARREVEALETGRDASRIALEKNEAAREIMQLARDWLLRAGAARLVNVVIDRHRQRYQDPVVARISAFFERASAGAFAGVVVDYDDRDQPVLKGLRPGQGAEKVGVEAMSEGTRDQLFLSIRLALLEQRNSEGLPFIGDDLLASFDDERAGRTLETLAEFGAARQTILFTHHRHIANIAQARLGDGLDLIELDG